MALLAEQHGSEVFENSLFIIYEKCMYMPVIDWENGINPQGRHIRMRKEQGFHNSTHFASGFRVRPLTIMSDFPAKSGVDQWHR